MHAKVIVPTLLLAASVNVGAVQFKRAPELEVQVKRDAVGDFFQGVDKVGNELGNLAQGILAALPPELATPVSSFLAQATPILAQDFDVVTSAVGQIFANGVPGAAPTPIPGSDASGSGAPPAPAAVTPPTTDATTTAPPTDVTPPPSRRGFMDNVSSIINQLPTEIGGPAQSIFQQFQAGYSSGVLAASAATATSSPSSSPSTSTSTSTSTPTAPPSSSSASSTESPTSTSSTASGTPTQSSNGAVGNLSFSRGSLTGMAAVVGSVLLGSIVAF